ncbi:MULTISPECIES: microviridin/marinostatin family tricyclic proteinase inhibitor [Chryseobacterium]|uniref:Serine endopeptidase inhibitors n=1 Tax=Chryseobacterium polytrichastri TaxID=1302687 RepID=A0A1M7DBP8_9FLAO|nr:MULTISPECIES: microviridin/marinostatin family tricyclic proteinase inhibitor [Chryseobacterium]KPH11013.1 serine endopeptidase [Chryseobacterium sp. ERMR1:04]SHL76875.1 Serine endopeptidase inhibitors [Chryseobacterium polytrichastri]
MKNKDSKKKPFFASFLEKQLKEPQKVKGGTDITIPERDSVYSPGPVTMKPTDMAYTQKYPSDGDDDAPVV